MRELRVALLTSTAPHSALGMLTAAECTDQWKRTNPPPLS